MSKPDEILYCVAILKYLNGNWIADFEYLHAKSLADARIKYTCGNSGALLSGKLKITNIGPSVGYFQDRSDVIYV